MGGHQAGRHPAEILTLGFGTSVAMWAVGYVGRLPSVVAPGRLLLALFVVCLLGGGVLAALKTERGWAGGLLVGAVSGLVNLLVLGSLLGGDRPDRLVPTALAWVPGFLLASAALGAVGTALGSAVARGTPRTPADWVASFARVAVGATLLLLAVGGLVTSHEAGLAVVDWPNSYGYNMFLFPLSKMTGGVYYEHAHRLFGALVGLTTLVLAGLLQAADDRRWMKNLGWLALGLVVVQGLLGGLRVTGRLTLSALPQDVSPNVHLAVVHGVLGQVFLGLLVAIAVFTSRAFRGARPAAWRDSAPTDRVLCAILIPLIVFQIVLGAFQRHLASGLTIHVAMAAVVAALAIVCGARAWGLNPQHRPLRVLGHALAELTLLQMVLGLTAFVALGGAAATGRGTLFEITAATLHQWCGAVLLACAVMLMLWTWRLYPRSATGAPVSG